MPPARLFEQTHWNRPGNECYTSFETMPAQSIKTSAPGLDQKNNTGVFASLSKIRIECFYIEVY
jgi:hypothetical protein